MDPIYQKEFQVTDLVTDCFGRVKPSAILYYLQEAAGQHSNLLGAGWDVLSEKGLFWAVTRHKVQISRLPQLGETITVRTWPMPTTRVAYPRAAAAYDSQGQELFRAISLWVLMDKESRQLILPGKSGVEVAGMLCGTELTLPRSLAPIKLESNTLRTVTYSCLDRNGHMNNTRYLDWVDDLLPSGFHGSHMAREFTVCYANEALEGQTLQMEWQLGADGQLLVDAHRRETNDSEKNTRVFSAQVIYERFSVNQ